MTNISPEERAAWGRLAEAATAGPWTVEVEEEDYGNSEREGQLITLPEIQRALFDADWADQDDWDRDLANAEFIAAARLALPRLLAALAGAEAERDALWQAAESQAPLSTIEQMIARLAVSTAKTEKERAAAAEAKLADKAQYAEQLKESNDSLILNFRRCNEARHNAEAKLATAERALACDACDGSGTALSGPCGCRGRGLPEMLVTVREALCDAELTAEMAQRDATAHAGALREALAFYADPENYQIQCSTGFCMPKPTAEWNTGQRARDALAAAPAALAPPKETP